MRYLGFNQMAADKVEFVGRQVPCRRQLVLSGLYEKARRKKGGRVGVGDEQWIGEDPVLQTTANLG